MLKRVFFIGLLASPLPALADSIGYGAVTRCDPKAGIFELGALVQFNEQITIVASKLAGTRQLPYGENKLNCKIGRKSIEATVNVWKASNGRCMGGGFAELSRVSIAGVRSEHLWNKAFFNFQCDDERSLVSLAVRHRTDFGADELLVTRCEATWKWATGFGEMNCTTDRLQ